MYRKRLPHAHTHVVTRVSHGAREIGDEIAKRMANQLCLRLGEFWRLVDCDLSEAEWDSLISERCAGGQNPFMRRGGAGAR